jgi:predicted nucleic acid-binding protein
VISELVKPFPNGKVINWLRNTPDDRLFLSVVTIGEIRKGISKLGESKKKTLLTNWLNTLIQDYQNRIYPIDLMVAENWGNLQGMAEKTGNPMSSFDSLIAAIAYTHNLVLVTRNEKDFAASHLPIVNPWKINEGE